MIRSAAAAASASTMISHSNNNDIGGISISRMRSMITRTHCSSSNSDSADPSFSSTSSPSSGSEPVLPRRKSRTPKLEPFSMSKMDRLLKNPPLIERTRNELADYCGRLEGDECYSCWDAYLELRYLEKECSKREVENLITVDGAAGLKALVQRLHRRTAMIKNSKQQEQVAAAAAPAAREPQHDLLKPNPKTEPDTDRHIPDGIPIAKSEEEEEEGGIMDDSPYTRMLRVIARGGYPTHYNPAA
ncbi:hypothetical protein Dimus_002265 [Dionaea muscipula]